MLVTGQLLWMIIIQHFQRYVFGTLLEFYVFLKKKKKLKVQKIFSKTFQVHEKHFNFTGNISSSQKSRVNFGAFFA